MAFIRVGSLILNPEHIISAEQVGDTVTVITSEITTGPHTRDSSTSARHILHGWKAERLWWHLSGAALILEPREEYTMPTPAARPALSVVSS